MAKRRLLKFFLSLVVLFFVVSLLAVAGAWMMRVQRPGGAQPLDADTAHRRRAGRDDP